MKKVLASFLAMILIVSTLAACSGDNTPPEHVHSWSDWKTVTEPTCISEGLQEKVCACGEKETLSIKYFGHTVVSDPAKAPTCTESGLAEGWHCSVCNHVIIPRETVPAKGHVYDNDQDSSCNVCGYIRNVACTHTNITKLSAINATCTQTGLTEGKKCSDCGEILIAQQTVLAAGHVYDDKYDDTCNACGHTRDAECAHTNVTTIPGVNATCTQDGFTEGKQCSKCGELLVAQTVINKLNHIQVIDAAVSPSCTKTGLTEGSHCSECGTVFVKQEIVPEIGHSFVQSVCEICGKKNNNEGLTYKLNSDGTCSITGIGSCTDLDIIIPEYIDGYKVTMIASGAFVGCSSLTSVTIGNNVAIIGSRAFKDCSSLMSINIPDNVTTIGARAFEGCSSLTSATIGNGLTLLYYSLFQGCSNLTSISIGNSVTSIGPGAFEGLSNLTNVIIGNGVTGIGNRAFAGCSSLTSITIPGNVTIIAKNAFKDCSSLMSINIPDNVTSIEASAFEGCSSLKAINISDNITSIEESTFAGCSSLTSITIPGNVTIIAKNAFMDCSNLISINIPDNVTSIGASAFRGCSSLTSITIGNGVTRIGGYAFKGCSSLKCITIPDSVTHIDNRPFENCNALEKMIVPFIGRDINDTDGVVGELEYFFGNYTKTPKNLRQIIITKDTEISPRAFAHCTSIETVSLPKGVTSIGEYAFQNCPNLTNIYFGGSKSEWNNIQFGANWNLDSDSYYVHYNALEYGIYLPTGAIRLVNSNRSYVLMPLGATTEIQVLNIKTGEIVPLRDTDITAEVISSGNRISILNGNLSGNNGGEGNLRAYFYENGKKIMLEDQMPIFVAESDNYQIQRNIRFSAADREYIGLCLEIYHSIYTMNDLDGMVNTNMNFVEGLLYGISSLDDYLEGLLEGDLPKTTVIKKAFGEFIGTYVDENYAHNMAVNDTKVILTGLKAINEIHDDYNKLTKLPTKVAKLFDKINELYIIATLEGGLTKDQVTTLFDSLSMITGYDEAMAEIIQTDVWKNTLSHYNQDYSSYVSAIKRVKSNAGLLENLFGSDNVFVMIWENKPDTVEAGMMALDSFIYALSDYSHNIELLETIRTQMLSKDCGYNSDDIEVHVINELISEYKNKWKTAARNFVSTYAADTIVSILTKHPAVSAVRIASDLAVSLTSIDDKAEWFALSGYVEALKKCTYPINDLYSSGKITSDKNEVSLYASLYINILLKTNKLAYDIAKFDPLFDNETKLLLIQSNIATLENILDIYF